METITEGRESMIIKRTAEDGELYLKYTCQNRPQPVYLVLDIETLELFAMVNGELGNTTTARNHHGIELRWRIPALRVAALATLMEQVRPMAETILAHSTVVWNGSNHVGVLDEDGHDAVETINGSVDAASCVWDETDVYEVRDASDYFGGLGTTETLETTKLSAASTVAEIKAAAEAEVAGATVALDVDEVKEYLSQLVDEELEEQRHSTTG